MKGREKTVLVSNFRGKQTAEEEVERIKSILQEGVMQ
jgi:hypothetical protein